MNITQTIIKFTDFPIICDIRKKLRCEWRWSDESLTDDYIITEHTDQHFSQRLILTQINTSVRGSFCSHQMFLWVSCSCPLWSCSSGSVLPAGTVCDPVCVKAAPAQPLSSSDHWSPAPVAPVVLQLDSLQSFPDLWSAVSPQSGFSQWSGWAQWRSSRCPPLLCVQSAVRTHITITQWASVSPDWDFSNFSSSPDSPYETLQPLSAAEDLSLSAGSSAGTTSASPSAASAAQTNNRDALYTLTISSWEELNPVTGELITNGWKFKLLKGWWISFTTIEHEFTWSRSSVSHCKHKHHKSQTDTQM